MMRIQWLETAPALIAREVLAIPVDLPLRLLVRVIDQRDVHYAFAEVERRLHSVGKPAALVLAHDQPIDDDLNQVLAAMIDLRRRIDAVRLVVNAHAHKTAATNLLE